MIYLIIYCLTVVCLSVAAVFYTRNTLKKLTLTTLLEMIFFISMPVLNTLILLSVTLIYFSERDEVVIWKAKD